MDLEKVNILLVDDDELFGLLVKKNLEEKGFFVDRAFNAKDAYELFCKNTYNLCLLDVVMPKKDGFALAKEIKAKNENVPFIFITANAKTEQTLAGFDTGADDYVTKPFAMEELLVRMKAILRRSNTKPKEADSFEKFNIGKHVFNYSMQTLTLNNKIYRLTTKETQLLHLLVLNQNKLLDRAFALQSIWSETSYYQRRSMDAYITKLRKFFANDNSIEILNVHKKGYILRVRP